MGTMEDLKASVGGAVARREMAGGGVHASSRSLLQWRLWRLGALRSRERGRD